MGRRKQIFNRENSVEKEVQLQSMRITKLSCSPLSLCFNPHSKPASLPPDKSKQELSFRPSIQTATAAVLRSIRSRRKRKEKELEIEKSVVVDVVAYANGKCWVSVVETCAVGIFVVLCCLGKLKKVCIRENFYCFDIAVCRANRSVLSKVLRENFVKHPETV